MSSKECEAQLNELLEAWDLDEATLNQTDIEAIKHLLLENQMQQDVIISYKTTNLDQAVDIQQLEQENKQLKLDYELYKDNCVYRNYEVEKKDITIKQLKEVIEEVRECLNTPWILADYETGEQIHKKKKELLQILDKVKDSDD